MIDVALVGCGRWGRRLLAALVAHPAMTVRALVDSDPVALAVGAAIAPGVALHASLEAALRRPLDAVFVATPPRLHADHALSALAAGCDVFVEKPLATHAVDAARLRDAQGDRVAMVGHILRFHPAVTDFVRAVAAGGVGRPREVIARRHTQSRSPDPLWALGPHDLATLHAIDPSPVVELDAVERHGGVALTLTLASALVARLDLSTCAPAPKRTTVVRGTEGLLSLDELDCSLGVVDPLRRELDHFVACVRDRVTPLTSMAEAHWVVAALERGTAQLAGPVPQLAAR